MESNIVRYLYSLVLFFLSGIGCSILLNSYLGFIFFGPPIFFVAAYILIIASLKGSRSIDLKEVAVIVMSFYAGFAMFDLALEILKNFLDSAMFPEVIFSVVGGGLVQLYTWRDNKFPWKISLILANTIIAGVCFGLFLKAHFLADPHYRTKMIYAFTLWFSIVGPITIMGKIKGLENKNLNSAFLKK